VVAFNHLDTEVLLYLTPTQRRHVALAELPDPIRDEAINSSFNLKNGVSVCTPPSNQPPGGGDSPPLRPWPFGIEAPDPSRPHAKRDWLKSELAEKHPGVKWHSLSKRGFWKWREAFRGAIRELEGIEDNAFKARAINFMTCRARASNGALLHFADGEKRIAPYTCGETACPLCNDREREKTSRDLTGFASAVAKAQGIKRFWRPVFTLPDEVADQIPHGSPERKALLLGLKVLLRKVFGLKTRDLLAMYANIHAVGDNDLLKTRFHIHTGILPIAIRTHRKSGEKWQEVVQCDPDGLLDRKAIENAWRELLESVFNMPFKTVVVHLQYVDLTAKRAAGKLTHAIKYDLRGFGKEFEKAPLRFAPATSQVVLSAENGGYHVITVQQLAERWQWLRKQRDMRTWGIFDQRSRYADLLLVDFVEEPEPEVLEEEVVTITRRVGRAWVNGKPRWINEKSAVRENGEIVDKSIKWGRRGRAEWRPRPTTSGAATSPDPGKPFKPMKESL
jgi:hypothetical protein